MSENIPDAHDQLEFPDIIEGPNCSKVACPIIPKDKGFKTVSQRKRKKMSKGQSKATDSVDVEDDHQDRVAASGNGRLTFVRDNGMKGMHLLKHDEGIDVNNCNTEALESLERSCIEDSDARGDPLWLRTLRG